MQEINADAIVNEIKWHFDNTLGYRPEDKKIAVIGISGGKDSSVVAALCAKALGPENVIGVMMPNGRQADIDDSNKICSFLRINQKYVNIGDAFGSITKQLDYPETTQMKTNLPARLRMATLYAIAQSVNGRVIGTSNLSEALLGWGTLWGDTVADLMPIKNLHSVEVVELGRKLGLPKDLIEKAPSDGMCGQTDEDKFGFTYQDVYDACPEGGCKLKDSEKLEKIHSKFKAAGFKKRLLINIPVVNRIH